mmetsp:Transcript_3544/g.11636  ORF Transcript_3544/g.11636 Transcript_3544/m.11636 type:complete len:284 (-) Transcript_3544:35-886(-)
MKEEEDGEDARRIFFLQSVCHESVSLLADVGPGLFDVGDDLDGVGLDLVPVLGLDVLGVEERRDEAHAEGPALEVLAGVVQVDAAGGVELEHGEGGGDGLDPGDGAGDAGEDLLDGSAHLVGRMKFGGSLASRNVDDLALGAPVDDFRNEDGRNNELGAGVHGIFRVEDGHDRPATDHDLALVLRSEVGYGVEASRRRQRELRDLEPPGDRRRHRLRRRLRRRRTQHRARSMRRKGLENLVVGLLRLRIGHPPADDPAPRRRKPRQRHLSLLCRFGDDRSFDR